MSKATYTGHVADGGLQGHSVGDTHPWAVVGYERDGRTMYRAENLVSGERLPLRFDSLTAIEDAEHAHQRAVALREIERLSGHKLPHPDERPLYHPLRRAA